MGGEAAELGFEPIADYFAVVGSPLGGERVLDPALHNAESLRRARELAVTDVTVVRVGRGETCPEGYEMLKETVGGRSADLNSGSLQGSVYLAVKRGLTKKDPTYLAGVSVKLFHPRRHSRAQQMEKDQHYQPAQQSGFPKEKKVSSSSSSSRARGPDWDLVEKTKTGLQAKLNKGGDDIRLALWRVDMHASECPAPVTELCVILESKEEKFPPGFRPIKEDLNRGRGKFGDVVKIGYRTGDPVSLSGLAFAPHILDRYPPLDSEVFPFPQEQLPMFTHPRGITLTRSSSHNTPKPTYFSFVFTNEDGRRTYSACLTFFEPLNSNILSKIGSELDLEDVKAPEERIMDAGNDCCFFVPKTICIISRFPIYGILRRFLRHLYAISLSGTLVPLEKYIAGFVNCIPMPLPGGRGLHVYLEPLEGGDPAKSRLKPLNLQLPPHAWLPLMDVDFTAPFRCLSVHCVLTVFSLMLQEAKLLFVSSRSELLTQVMESLRSLLFPLEWQSVYIPRLPQSLSCCLECPGGFMIGMHLKEAELLDGTAALAADLGLAGVASIVNLDSGDLLLASMELLSSGLPDECSSPLHGGGMLSSQASMDVGQELSQDLSGGGGGALASALSASTNLLSLGSSRLMRRGSRDREGDHERRKTIDFSSVGGLKRNPTHPVVPWRRKSSLSRDASSRHSMERRYLTERSRTYSDGDETMTHDLPDALRVDLQMRLESEVIQRGGVRLLDKAVLDQYESAFEFGPSPDADASTIAGHVKSRMPFSSTRILASDIISVRQAIQKELEARKSAPVTGLSAPAAVAASSTAAEFGQPATTAEGEGARPSSKKEGPGWTPLSRPESVGQARESDSETDSGLIIRDLFVATMAELLGGIGRFVKRSEIKRVSGNMNVKPLNQLFDMEDFLRDLEISVRPFVRRITTTQMFWVLVQQRLESGERDPQLVFFEDCVTALRNRKAGAVIPMRDFTERSPSISVDGLILLVDEVRLGHPDLYGMNHSSALCRTGGGLPTPAMTPTMLGREWLAQNLNSPAFLSAWSTTVLSLSEDLNLADPALPPLVVPGPILPCAGEAASCGKLEVQSVHTYKTWPTPMDSTLLQIESKDLRTIVLRLQTESKREHHSDNYLFKKSGGRAAPLGTSLMYGEFEPMLVLPLEYFESHGCIPRSSEVQAMVVPYSSLKSQRKECLVVFVSHQWLASSPSVVTGSGDSHSQQQQQQQHHPDPQGRHHRLICDGVRRLLTLLATAKRAYIWIDFACIDQDDLKRKGRGVRSLPSYIERCDAILIPYLGNNDFTDDEDEGSPVVVARSSSMYDSVESAFFAGEEADDPTIPRTPLKLPDGIEERQNQISTPPSSQHSLTRVLQETSPARGSAEVPKKDDGGSLMKLGRHSRSGSLHQSHAPDLMVPNTPDAGMSANPLAGIYESGWPTKYPSLADYVSRTWCRAELFFGSHIPIPPDGLYFFDVMGMADSRAGDRPLFVYGAEQEDKKQPPLILPRLDASWFRMVSPVEGALSVEADRRDIFALVERVHCTTPAPPKPGFSGCRRFWVPHGTGKKVFEDGRQYTGEWRYGKMHGRGVMLYSRGSRYEGMWRHGKKHGKGVMIYPDGARYEGEWVSGWRHGTGTYLYASGASYEGSWRDGQMDGFGVYMSVHGAKYEGHYSKGKREGQGVMFNTDGRKYDGEWRQGLRSGRGTLFSADGSKFEGNFRHDRKHGRGLFFSSVDLDPKPPLPEKDDSTGGSSSSTCQTGKTIFYQEWRDGHLIVERPYDS